MAFTILLVACLIAAVVILSCNLSEKTKTVDEMRWRLSESANEKQSYFEELNYKTSILQNYENAGKTLDSYERMIADAKKELKSVKTEIENLQNDVIAENIVISEYKDMNSEECKNELVMIKNQIADLVKSDMLYIITNDSFKKKQLNDNKKQILRCFTAECTNVIDNLTLKNVDTARGKITRAFENINKIFSSDGLELRNDILELKLKELSLVYAVIVKKEQEREEQKAIREQMLEEEKVRREIEREKAKLDKEETQFKNEINKLMNYMQKASDIEKQLYVDKIKELEEKIKGIEKDKENVLQREQNTRAGFVYVISNIGSFGEDVYKIGMTRRLEPMDRVKELGDASVPFEFDVHAMIFSDDAPALENILHTKFRDNAVNKVNLKKEFYKVSLDEIEKEVKEKYNATITFTKVAEAAQYRESLKIANAQQNGNTTQNSTSAKAVAAASDEWVCNSCGSSVNNLYIQCPYCGSDK